MKVRCDGSLKTAMQITKKKLFVHTQTYSLQNQDNKYIPCPLNMRAKTNLPPTGAKRRNFFEGLFW